MSLRLEMLQVARLAPQMLGESAGLVREFLLSQQNPDGGFKDRAGRSDLYYTVFGLDALAALQAEPNLPTLHEYLARFGSGEALDFVHAGCLAHCWRGSGMTVPEEHRRRLAERLETYRSRDGGYHSKPGAAHGTIYGCFLATGAYLNLGLPLPQSLEMFHCLRFLQTPDGAWANEYGMTQGSANATAAAVTLARVHQVPVRPEAAAWLLQQAHPQGGFLAAPGAPIPDLLSTATALHALSGLQASFESIKEPCLDFVDSLWTNEGGFHGHWADDDLDCEYTFYGLLALGHLSL